MRGARWAIATPLLGVAAACIPELGYVECFRAEDCPSAACDVSRRRCVPAGADAGTSADAGRDATLDTGPSADGEDAGPDAGTTDVGPGANVCWQNMVPITGPDPTQQGLTGWLPGGIVTEHGRLRLYLSTEQWANGTGYPTRIGRSLLLSPSSTSSVVEPLPNLDLTGMGWTAAPSLASGGLEIFYDASYPNSDYTNHNQLYHAFRASTEDDWSPVEEILAEAGVGFSPVLLSDGLTLLYAKPGLPAMQVARRAAKDPSARFQVMGDGPFPQGHVTVGCDPRFLIVSDMNFRVLKYELRSLDPLVVDHPVPLMLPNPGPAQEHPELMFESPDCSKIYVGYRPTQVRAISAGYVADACP
jgi:hypothetical protein